jgi:hypothetical protein
MAAGLLSVCCCFGPTWLAIQLQSVKTSAFFTPRVRGIIADFAVVGAAAVFIVLDRVVFQSVRSETLRAPDELGPSFVCCEADCRRFFPDDCPEMAAGSQYGNRPWVVNFFDLNGQNWIPLFAAVPALLGFILLFLDNGITWHLINSPDNKLKHGHAYNYDTVLIGVGVFVNSCFGLPWLCAATVRSVNHLLALAEVDGKTKKIVSVQETRLTHLLIHCLIMGTLFSMRLLKAIPMSVLYGIFLYMGVTALAGNQFWERIKMMIMQPSSANYPDRPYTEPYLPRKKMHMMTVMQLSCFVLLYGVKSIKQIAIAFPIIIALCIPVRTMLLPKFFTADELTLLDGEDEDIKRVMAKMDGDVEAVKAPPEPVKQVSPSEVETACSPAEEETGSPAPSVDAATAAV